jgi:hypothetical protein
MVPLGQKTALSMPKRFAVIDSNVFMAGSSPKTSSPTGVECITSRISEVGLVTVSDLKSIIISQN